MIVVVGDRRCGVRGCESDGRPSTLLEPQSSGATGVVKTGAAWKLLLAIGVGDLAHSGHSTPASVRGCDRVEQRRAVGPTGGMARDAKRSKPCL